MKAEEIFKDILRCFNPSTWAMLSVNPCRHSWPVVWFMAKGLSALAVHMTRPLEDRLGNFSTILISSDRLLMSRSSTATTSPFGSGQYGHDVSGDHQLTFIPVPASRLAGFVVGHQCLLRLPSARKAMLTTTYPCMHSTLPLYIVH